MPISMAPQVMSISTASPILWPSVRCRPRWVAQRPLPSITTATWLGTWSAGICGAAAFEVCCGGRREPAVGVRRQVRKHHGPRRLVGEGRIVVRRRGQLWVAWSCPPASSPWLTSCPNSATRCRRPCDRPGTPVRPAAMFAADVPDATADARPPARWPGCGTTAATPARAPSRRRGARPSGPARPAAASPTRTGGSARTRCRRPRRGTPDADPARRSGRIRSARAPSPAIPMARNR